jgi:hypothetical protein
VLPDQQTLPAFDQAFAPQELIITPHLDNRIQDFASAECATEREAYVERPWADNPLSMPQ